MAVVITVDVTIVSLQQDLRNGTSLGFHRSYLSQLPIWLMVLVVELVVAGEFKMAA